MYDYRRALNPGTVLRFPGMECTLGEEIGRGSNAIVYRGTYPDLLNQEQKHVVLIKELFPFHDGQQIVRAERSDDVLRREEGEAVWATHMHSFEAGNAAHLALLAQYPDQVGGNINTFVLNNTLYTVLGYSGGRSLAQELPAAAGDLRGLTLRMIGLMDALRIFHEQKRLHLDIAPDNILLVGEGAAERVMLIDFNSVYDLDGIPDGDTLYYSVKPGYSAPEVRRGNLQRFQFATDLFSAAAVFYRCLTGEALTPTQMIDRFSLDVDRCPCLADAPQTVVSMVEEILRCGLQSIPRRRYQSVGDMKRALQELLDRIDGVGITHWALWEAGRRSVGRVIRENPSYRFLEREEEIFPANAALPGGMIVPMEERMSSMLAGRGTHVLMTAAGGMGKTTVMLRSVLRQSGKFSPLQPALAYVSLYGWKSGDNSYILDRILETLHYRAQTRSFADARLALTQLLDEPLPGGRPVLLVMLDGLNEAAGDTQALYEEIIALSKRSGVRLLVTARSADQSLPFENVQLSPLTDEDVRRELAKRGLLPPETEEMRALLRTPLMLSIFLQSAQAEQKQIIVQSREELIRAYLAALNYKEISPLPEGADVRWQIEAATGYVLPAIAAEMNRRRRAMSDAELLKVVEKCYWLTAGRALRKAFPQWIGRGRAIRSGVGSAEEWYGRIVHELLWKRMGLLVRNDSGGYQLIHQIIGEHLADEYSRISRKIAKIHRMQIYRAVAAVALAVTAAVGAYHQFFKPQPYNTVYADTVFTCAVTGYVNAGNQYDSIRRVLDSADGGARYASQRQLYAQNAYFASLSSTEEYALHSLEQMLLTGEVMPWSGEPFDGERFRQLIALVRERGGEYAGYLEVLDYVMSNDGVRSRYGTQYPQLLADLVEIDAAIAADLYQIVCEPHMTGKYADDSTDAQSIRSMTASATGVNQKLTNETDLNVLIRNLNTHEGQRAAAAAALEQCGATGAYKLTSGGD